MKLGSRLVNPSVGREFEWDGDRPPPAETPRDILVVGGGPAGLETARVAAERGHKVTVVERGEIGELLAWYQGQLEQAQVQIKLRTEMNADDVLSAGADAVVLCTGSQPSRDGFQRALPHVARLPGADQDNVSTVHDVLDGTVVPGTRVLLLDDLNGWWPASGTALDLAQRRHQVTLVTSADQAAGQLEDSGTAETTRERFVKYGVETVTATALLSWQGNTARLVNLYSGEAETRDFDALVLATTNTPEDALTHALGGSGREIHAIGDTVSARTAAMAIYEGRKLGLRL